MSDAVELARRIRSGELSPVEAVDAAIARIEERNPELNAVVATRFEQARAEAATVDPTLPFAGVPFLVKDLGAKVAGLPNTRGSRLWADDVATADSELVARYRRAGLIVLGVTNTPELGKNASTEPLLHGPARNPWRTTHSTGGSSGGSAGAVASGMVPAAHGNDAGGSIRLPSSMCGLFGLKPSRGLVPSLPAADAFTYPVGVGHALTTTVRDSAALLDVAAAPVAGAAYAAPTTDVPYATWATRTPPRLRIALSLVPPSAIPVDDGVAAAVRAVAATCEQLGHEVVEATPAVPSDELRSSVALVMGVSVAAAVDERLAALGRELRDDDLEPMTRAMCDRGRAATAVELTRALQGIERTSLATGAFFEEYDVLLTPTVAVPVPPLGLLDTTNLESMGRHAGAVAAFTALYNATGQPAMSVPAGQDSTGMPTGAQLATALGGDGLLLALAAQLEAAMPWPRTAR